MSLPAKSAWMLGTVLVGALRRLYGRRRLVAADGAESLRFGARTGRADVDRTRERKPRIAFGRGSRRTASARAIRNRSSMRKRFF